MCALPIWFVTPMFLGSSLNPVNSSLIATALVPIAAAMHTSVGRTAVLVSALYLASSIAQPTAGKLSEEFGPRRVFLAGIITVLIGGVVGGVGQNLTTLIAARVLIGVGTSAGYPSAMLLIRRRAEQAGLAKPPGGVLGGLQIAGAATAALGLPFGGVLVGAWGWRATFFANVPVALVTLVMAVSGIPRDAPVQGSRKARDIAARIDLAGIAGFGGAMTALLVFLMSVPHPDWAALGAAVVLAAALVAWELRAADPMVPLRLFRSRAFAAGNAAAFCVFATLLSLVFFMAQFLETGLGYGPFGAGLRLLPGWATLTLIAPFSGTLISRVGERPLIASGLSLTAGGLAWIALIARAGLPYSHLVAPLVMAGVGASIAIPATMNAVMTSVPPAAIGKASGTLNMLRQLGGVFGIAICAAVFAAHGDYASPATFASGFAPALGACAGLAVLGAVAGLAIPSRTAQAKAAPVMPPQPVLETEGSR